MSLIDELLPTYQFSERHTCRVTASSTTIIDSVPNYRPERDPLFRAAIALRELPMRFLRRKVEHPAPFSFSNFTLLGRRDGEIVYGLVGRFWEMDFGLRAVADGQTFVLFDTIGVAKLVLGFSAVRNESGGCVLTTETRVFCPDPASRLRFLPYWLLIRPVSGLIRRRVLSAIKMQSEKMNLALE